MVYNRVINRFLLIAVPVALFVYASWRPVTRLSPQMPPTFVDISRQASAPERATEEHIAQAYWDCAVTVIQWEYTYGSSLPDNPPDEFQMYAGDSVNLGVHPDSRLRYWWRLQQAWYSPETWTTSREWTMRWLTDPFNHGVEGIRGYFRSLIKTG
jgi:hypothetical protein